MPVIALLILGASLFGANLARKKLGPYAPIILFLAVSLICEIFCFNFESFRSLTYPEIENYTITCSPTVTEKDGSYTLRSASDFISIKNMDGRVESIHVKTNTTRHTLRFFVSDGANEIRYHAGDRIISRYSEQSGYIKTNFTGSATEIKLYVPDIENRVITLSDIRLNCRRPVFFSILRPIVCFLSLMFVYYIIVKKRLWQKKYNIESKRQSNFTMFVACTLAIMFLLIPYINPGFINPTWAHHNQYNELAQAFLDGQLHLEREVPDVLLEMENPYDRNMRKQVFSKAGLSEPWDTALYNGKYYVYFGVLPVLLFYLPAQALGFDFPNFLAVVIFSWVLIAGVFLLYGKIIKMYLKDTPYLLYLVLSVTTVLTGGVLYIIKRPDFYSIPIMGALAFTVMGLYFWVSSLDYDKISRWRMLTGSIFMALVLSLRPNLVFFSCAAFLIYWDSVFRDRELLSINSRLSDEKLRGLKNTVAFCAPYIIVGVLVMIYNAARFSSPFDFGASYNLTTSDMTQRGFMLDRWGLGVFEYLFRPPAISATFPFLSSNLPQTAYIGFTSREGMFGGIFAAYPVLWSLFAMHKAKDQKKPFKLALFLLGAGFVTCLIDIQAGGILPRYTCDFAVFFVMAAAITLMMLYKEYPSLATKFAAWGLLCMVVYDVLLIIAGGSSTLQTMNKQVYMYFFDEFCFFL
ncbi:MAG: hypothetical protein IJO83_05125 [Clostridia bacterium]|nr:hypothetical protein [Clostridia bacterium]